MLKQRGKRPSDFEAIRSVAAKLIVGSPETLRQWLVASKSTLAFGLV